MLEMMRKCGAEHYGYCPKEARPFAHAIVLRIKDQAATRFMVRIPTDVLPPNANTAEPLNLTITYEWDNHPQIQPERMEVNIPLSPWGNPYE